MPLSLTGCMQEQGVYVGNSDGVQKQEKAGVPGGLTAESGGGECECMHLPHRHRDGAPFLNPIFCGWFSCSGSSLFPLFCILLFGILEEETSMQLGFPVSMKVFLSLSRGATECYSFSAVLDRLCSLACNHHLNSGANERSARRPDKWR